QHHGDPRVRLLGSAQPGVVGPEPGGHHEPLRRLLRVRGPRRRGDRGHLQPRGGLPGPYPRLREAAGGVPDRRHGPPRAQVQDRRGRPGHHDRLVRVLLFTGKGGVGKTTVAAATALRCAELGHRTIVVSTDPAHSLADAFDRPLDGRPVAVRGRLWGQQLDTTERWEETWGEVQAYLTQLFDWAGLDAIEAEE